MRARKLLLIPTLCVCLIGSSLADELIDSLTIPGSDTGLEVLPGAVEWDFELLPNMEAERMTLAKFDDGPGAEEAIAYRFRSVEPYGDRGPGGYTYLRFWLNAFRFEDAAAAGAALEDVFPASDTSNYVSQCFAGGYWLQHGPWVYELGVPCLFSAVNYGRLIRALNDGLGLTEESRHRAVKCICGGGWETPD